MPSRAERLRVKEARHLLHAVDEAWSGAHEEVGVDCVDTPLPDRGGVPETGAGAQLCDLALLVATGEEDHLGFEDEQTLGIYLGIGLTERSGRVHTARLSEQIGEERR